MDRPSAELTCSGQEWQQGLDGYARGHWNGSRLPFMHLVFHFSLSEAFKTGKDVGLHTEPKSECKLCLLFSNKWSRHGQNNSFKAKYKYHRRNLAETKTEAGSLQHEPGASYSARRQGSAQRKPQSQAHMSQLQSPQGPETTDHFSP